MTNSAHPDPAKEKRTTEQIANEIAYASSADHYGEEAGLRGWQAGQIKQALDQKDAQIAALEGELKLHEGAALRYEKMRADNNDLDVELGNAKDQLSAYKFLFQFTPEECRYLKSNQERLEAQIGKLREALSFYADLRNYKEGAPGEEVTTRTVLPDGTAEKVWEYDEGCVAREILASTEEKKDE